jgi:hypothetical protein
MGREVTVQQDHQRMKARDVEELAREWWPQDSPDGSAMPFRADEEVLALNAMARRISRLPQWALKVRGAMAGKRSEMCAHRWLDGLDEMMSMIGSAVYWPSKAGHCGDVPGSVVAAVDKRVAALQAWIGRRTPAADRVRRRVALWLGEPAAEKREAAICFVELARAFCGGSQGDEPRALAAQWRKRASQNQVLGALFGGQGLDGLLSNWCGFKFLERLDQYLRAIGGEVRPASASQDSCRDQLGSILRDDPARFEATRAYLWGLWAYLQGCDARWLSSTCSEWAGSAMHAYRLVSAAGAPSPLTRWLAGSLLKTAKMRYERALAASQGTPIPPHLRHLPQVTMAAN